MRGEGRVRGKVMVLIVYTIGVWFRHRLRVGFRLRVRLRVRVSAGSRLGTTFSTISIEQN